MFATTRARPSFSVDDLEKATEFYGGVLGLAVREEAMGVLSVQTADFSLIVYPKADHEPATFTVLNFEVADIESVVDELRARGVTFETYDVPEIKTDARGIASDNYGGPRIAWFKDPAGNVLSVIEQG